jgi:hypothetical protein
MSKTREALKKRREALKEKVRKLEETQVIIEKMLHEFNESPRIKPNYLLMLILIININMYRNLLIH